MCVCVKRRYNTHKRDYIKKNDLFTINYNKQYIIHMEEDVFCITNPLLAL